MSLIGDGAMTLIAARERALVWRFGRNPASWQAEHPRLMRLEGTSSIALGWPPLRRRYLRRSRGVPDVFDPKLGAFAHRLFGDLRARRDHDRLDAARNRAQVVIGGVAFKLLCVRVYGEHLVSPLPKPSINDVGSVAREFS